MSTAIQKLPTYIQEKVAHAQVPIKYTAAIKALAACRSIDEVKYFADKSDALAVWAKIYQNDQVAVEAKRLKLHAFRRMGILATEIQPGRGDNGSKSGGPPGPAGLLRQAGLPGHDAQSATSLSRLSDKKFRAEVESERPHAPSFFRDAFYGSSDSWVVLAGKNGRGSMQSFRAFCRKENPKTIAKSLSPSEAKKAKEMATEIIEWMDTFDQYLPKE